MDVLVEGPRHVFPPAIATPPHRAPVGTQQTAAKQVSKQGEEGGEGQKQASGLLCDWQITCCLWCSSFASLRFFSARTAA